MTLPKSQSTSRLSPAKATSLSAVSNEYRHPIRPQLGRTTATATFNNSPHPLTRMVGNTPLELKSLSHPEATAPDHGPILIPLRKGPRRQSSYGSYAAPPRLPSSPRHASSLSAS